MKKIKICTLLCVAAMSLGTMVGCGSDTTTTNETTTPVVTESVEKENTEITPTESVVEESTPTESENEEVETVVEPEKVALAEDGSNFLEVATDVDSLFDVISNTDSYGFTVEYLSPEWGASTYFKEAYAFGGTVYTVNCVDNNTENKFSIFINEDQTVCSIYSASLYFQLKGLDNTDFYYVPTDMIPQVLSALNDLDTQYHNQCELFSASETKFEKLGNAVYVYCTTNGSDACYKFTVSERDNSVVLAEKNYNANGVEYVEDFQIYLNKNFTFAPYSGVNAYETLGTKYAIDLNSSLVNDLCETIRHCDIRTK